MHILLTIKVELPVPGNCEVKSVQPWCALWVGNITRVCTSLESGARGIERALGYSVVDLKELESDHIPFIRKNISWSVCKDICASNLDINNISGCCDISLCGVSVCGGVKSAMIQGPIWSWESCDDGKCEERGKHSCKHIKGG